ncbi:lipoprotein [Vibrio cincinnatiensis]
MIFGKRSLLYLVIILGLSGCNDSDDDVGLTLTIAHINDHHSKLDANENMTMNLNGRSVYNDVGGFAKVVTQFRALEPSFRS